MRCAECGQCLSRWEAEGGAVYDRELARVEAERDRYRKALTQIYLEDYRGPEPASRRIAREALRNAR